MSESFIPKLAHISREQVWLTGGTLLTTGIADLALHGGTPGIVVGLAASIFVARHSKDILDSCVPGRDVTGVVKAAARVVDAVVPEPSYADQSAGAKVRRLFALKAQESDYARDVQVGSERGRETYDEDEDELQPMTPSSDFTFSSVLQQKFQPSLSRIFLAAREDGQVIYSDAESLCHVALAGATGGGKSVIMRLLMAQLCKSGASVLLLNPHYTKYDLKNKEDWTPFEPYLVHPPMECRKYDVIGHYLKQCATVLLPKRLERYAHSQPTGKPYFIVIDELPAIVDHIPDAPKYLSKILREGRKVGILLITAAQDFLVKTVSPQGGGGIRDCYRTAYYVGGDATTARVLLDLQPGQKVPEDELGRGVVMLRNLSVKKATMAYVPYVDNAALYRLLGPSTYKATRNFDEDTDNFLENLRPGSVQPAAQVEREYLPRHNALPPMPAMPEKPRPSDSVQPVSRSRVTQNLTPELQMALNIYTPGMTYREFGLALGVSKDTAGKYLQQLKDRRLI